MRYESSTEVLQIPHVTTYWQTFLGLACGEFLAGVPGIFHCLIPGTCEEDEAVWPSALSFRSLDSFVLSLFNSITDLFMRAFNALFDTCIVNLILLKQIHLF